MNSNNYLSMEKNSTMPYFKRRLFLISTFFVVLNIFQVSGMAQTRIRFKRGASSATVSGTLEKNASKCFVLEAREGQLIDARLRSRSSKVQFPLYFCAGPYKGGTSYSTMTYDQDNEICIENTGKAATFSLIVSIR